MVQMAPAPKIVGLQRAEVSVHPKFGRASRRHLKTTASSRDKSSLKNVRMLTILGKTDKANSTYSLSSTPTNLSKIKQSTCITLYPNITTSRSLQTIGISGVDRTKLLSCVSTDTCSQNESGFNATDENSLQSLVYSWDAQTLT